ncbi:ABC transporter substrate-binding protein [Actinotalea subterranea]|uniref:ABC transporter substrate-binding protein n=1 Tax=Actinotalea subterranea TaxID=2607497 RepID=UPI0011EF6090|nr:sugar ABC transporter substrate-binding protein [Actinotalea subterranea]
MNSRSPIMVLAASAAVLALASCSSGGTGDDAGGSQDVTLTYTNFISNNGNEENLDAIVAAFEDENPGVTVDVTTMAYADYFTALQTDLAAGTVSDVFDIEYGQYGAYQANGVLAEVTLDDPAAFDPTLLETYQTGGTQYAIPTSFSNVVLFYNTTLFDAAGVEYPTADWTWAQEKTAAEALTDQAAGVFGDYQPISYYEFYKALEQNGESFLGDDGKAAFDTPGGIEAIEWLAGKSGTVMPTPEQGAGTPDFDSGLFADGKLAMFHSGIWMFGTFADMTDEWDIVVEPGNTQQASAMFSNAVAVSATSEHPAEATAFAEFLAGSDVTAQLRLESGWELPPTSDETVVADYLALGAPANRQAVFDSLENVALTPDLGERAAEVQDVVDALLTEVAAGRVSAADAAAQMAEQVDAILG